MSIHDIWNPWHGCVKCSEGCENCYMFYLDRLRERDGNVIYKTVSGFTYPLQKDRYGAYKVKSGEMIRVCMNSDFFLEQADEWRADAWEIMRLRPDVKFFLLTKRPQRVKDCLPVDWGEGWENIFFNVTCENQQRTDERLPILLELPFKHKGVMCAPFIGEVSLKKYLACGQIEQVICGGENYDGARPCNFDWVIKLYNECREYDVSFDFIETGTVFVKDGKNYRMPDKKLQSEMAHKSGMSYKGNPIIFNLTDNMGLELSAKDIYKPYFSDKCNRCGSKNICNGCSKCGKCK